MKLEGVSSDCFDSSCEIDPAVVLTRHSFVESKQCDIWNHMNTCDVFHEIWPKYVRPTWLLCQRILELAKLHLRLATDAKDLM